MSIQAKHIDARSLIRLVAWLGHVDDRYGNPPISSRWVFTWDILRAWREAVGPVPEKVLYAKLRRLLNRGVLDGCIHNGKVQCRGDWIVACQGAIYANIEWCMPPCIKGNQGGCSFCDGLPASDETFTVGHLQEAMRWAR